MANILQGYESPTESDSDDRGPDLNTSATLIPFAIGPVSPPLNPRGFNPDADPANSALNPNIKNSTILGPVGSVPDAAALAGSPTTGRDQPTSPDSGVAAAGSLDRSPAGAGAHPNVPGTALNLSAASLDFPFDLAMDSPKSSRSTSRAGMDADSDSISSSDVDSESPVDADSDGITIDALSPSHNNRSGHRVFISALKSERAYTLCPESGKIVVLSTALGVRQAFQALVENNVRSAPLWDSTKGRYVGLITVSDVIGMLRHFYQSPFTGMQELESETIKSWRDISSARNRLYYVEPEDSLYVVVRKFIKYRIHRLPVLLKDTNTIMAILDLMSVLRHIYLTVETKPEFIEESIEALGVGTFKNVLTITPDTPVVVTLNCFAERRVSAVPVVDETGKLVDVYSKTDVYALAKFGVYDDLDICVEEAIRWNPSGETTPRPLYTCSKNDTLDEVVHKLLDTGVHRLICVDSTKRVCGVVSCGDVVNYLMGL